MPSLDRSVVAVAYDGLCAFEFGVATELFGLARPELGVDWYDFAVVSADTGPLRTVGGVTLATSNDLSKVERAGTIVLPGWRDPGEVPQAELLEAIRVGHTNGARVMSICSGVFVLAATGLLDGQQATTHWRYAERLAELYPRIEVFPDVLYIDNGTTLTSAGSAAGIDLGLHLIRRDYGVTIANQVARRLVVPPHRDGGQAQFITPSVGITNATSLAAVVDWAMASLADPITIENWAEVANMAPRTFARRFSSEMGTTPHKWLVRQRVSLAQQLLETTDASMDEVALRAGFVTAATLRHHFGRETRTTPTRYRATFSSAGS
ncbi:MAG: transcriptional regulator FtrA [Acidimicrobiales bacterium]